MSSSDSENENIIRYGTPLDPYEEDEVPSKRKYQEQTDQYAVDAHGRRRFHGAFTGGFSAGYGNSVGTPEGWTPATFKSSRSDKAQFSSQKAEDFMDEEDRSEHGIAPRQLQTSDEFSGRKRQGQRRYHDGPIPGEPVLERLVRAAHEPAAARMLRAMGWRPGQGAGARLSRADKRRARDQHKVYGCYMPPEMRQLQNAQQSDEESTDSEFEYETLFAPDDYEPYVLERKSDRFGLGYAGLSRHSVLGSLAGEYGAAAGGSTSHLVMRDKGKKVSIRGQAFGVGAFEADDEDIYATEDMSHYDFALGGADVAKEEKKVEKSSSVLEGFVRASKPPAPPPRYPPPALPRDYAPAPAGSRRSRFEPSAQPQRDQGLGRHELTAAARGVLLGEPGTKPADGPTPPATPAPAPASEPIKIIDLTKPAPSAARADDYIPLAAAGAAGAKVFRPFVNNPQKQARYEQYLREEHGAGAARGEPADRLSEWDRSRELVEFEQAAKLYKPLTGVMNDRFTHGSEPDDALNPLCAVARSAADHGLATPAQLAAAAQGAYGAATRTQAAWRPEPLVCKRFNVPEIGGSRPEPVKEDKPKLSYSIFSYLESSVHDKDSFTKEQTKFSGSKSLIVETPKEKPKMPNIVDKKDNQLIDKTTPEVMSSTGPAKRITVAELFLKESEKDLKDRSQGTEVTDTIEKFDKMDLYKSIFLSDDESDEDAPKPTTSDVPNDYYIDKPKNVDRNYSPPRGIFANIDFDEINSWKRKADNKNTETPNSVDSKHDSAPIASGGDAAKSNVEPQAEIDESNLYGPRVPDNLVNRATARPEPSVQPVFRTKGERDGGRSSSGSDSWVDAREVRLRKHKREKKKHKKHKSKHKKSKSKKKDR